MLFQLCVLTFDQYIQDVQGIQSISVGQAITLRYFTQIFCKAYFCALCKAVDCSVCEVHE